MSFLDRIRNNDKQEVELNPSEAVSTETRSGPGHRQQDGDDDEVELSDDSTGSEDSGGTFLPGTGPDTSSSESTATSSSSTTGTARPDEEKLDEIMEQNERIIELLEQIAGANSSSRSSSSDSASNSKELW
jgi:hypothetical protein